MRTHITYMLIHIDVKKVLFIGVEFFLSNLPLRLYSYYNILITLLTATWSFYMYTHVIYMSEDVDNQVIFVCFVIFFYDTIPLRLDYLIYYYPLIEVT